LAALTSSLYVALSTRGLGDYPGDAGPAMHALLQGDLHAFSASRPAMGTLSLVVRLPFAALAYLGSPTEPAIFRWGAFPCVAAIGLLGVWLAGLARARGTGLVGQVTIVALAIFNPFVQSALGMGHPEELLTASLAIGAVVAAVEERSILSAVLLGLAVATKQWAVIAAFPVVVVLDADRVRALAGAAVVAAVCTLPAFVVAPGVFVANNFALLHEHYLEPPAWSWLFPVAPRVTVHLVDGLVHRGPRLSAGIVGLLHPLIIATGAGIAFLLGRLDRRRRSVDRVFAAVALMFLLRCTLDTETMPYYHAPLFAALLAWDVMRGEQVPIRALGAAVVGYALFDRLTPAAVGPDTAAWLYAGVTLAAACLFTTVLAGLGDRARAPAGTRASLGGASP
jgi:hypothetical protein